MTLSEVRSKTEKYFEENKNFRIKDSDSLMVGKERQDNLEKMVDFLNEKVVSGTKEEREGAERSLTIARSSLNFVKGQIETYQDFLQHQADEEKKREQEVAENKKKLDAAQAVIKDQQERERKRRVHEEAEKLRVQEEARAEEERRKPGRPRGS